MVTPPVLNYPFSTVPVSPSSRLPVFPSSRLNPSYPSYPVLPRLTRLTRLPVFPSSRLHVFLIFPILCTTDLLGNHIMYSLCTIHATSMYFVLGTYHNKYLYYRYLLSTYKVLTRYLLGTD